MKNNLSTLVIVGDLKEIFFLGGGEGASWQIQLGGGGGWSKKKKYPDLSFPEVSICDVIPPIQMSLMSLLPNSLHLDD